MPTPTTTPTWYSIRPAAVAASAQGEQPKAAAEIWIYGDIGESWWEESVSASSFVREINALDVDAITVRINSFGGSVPDGLAIYNAIKRHKAHVTTAVDGIAFSCASLIAMAGDTVEMAENAMLMIHAPWTYMAGNSTELRAVADQLDTWAAAMAGSYGNRMGDKDAALALLTDGADHYFTAEQALAEGLVDVVGAATPIAASARAGVPANRFRPQASAAARVQGAPAAAAAQPRETTLMPTTTTPQAAAPTTAATVATATVPDAKTILAADAARRSAIRAAFEPHASKPGVADLLRTCEDSTDTTVEAAGLKLLAHLGSTMSSATGGQMIATVEDEADKFRAAAAQAILARAGVAGEKIDHANPLRGCSMVDIAKASLRRAGKSDEGLSMDVVASAFTQSGSDFPILLENAMHKTLQAAYATAALTWNRFCATGSVSDFRDHKRYRIGSLGNLDGLSELGEFKTKAIPDGERASIAAKTVGNIINLSRQAMVNDDLGAFVGLATMQGRAAARTVEAYVYAMLAQNSGLGPVMEDGKTLFHADHGNISAAGALSVATLEDARIKLASQKDVGGNDYLDLRPAILLCPMGLGGTARVLNAAEYDPDTANKLQRPNMVRGLLSDIVDTPRLTGTRHYLFASPSEAPVLEVAFLEGNQSPVLEQDTGFTVDGARFKVRLDFGVAAIDFRGAVTAAGQ